MFCPKCGTQIPDGSAFCMKCGCNIQSVLGGAQAFAPPPTGYQQPSYQQPAYQQAPYSAYPEPAPQAPTGMRTTAEMLAFMDQHLLGFKDAERHTRLIEQSLMPNETVQFCFCGNQNSQGIHSQGAHVYAFTNLRMLVAQAKIAFQKGNLKGVEIYTYDQIGNVSYSKGLLTGTISISFYNGHGSIMCEKKAVEFIYQEINKAIFNYRR